MLWKSDSNCRVIGARRWYLDFFHWNISIAWMAVMLELIIGTVPAEPPIRLLAMPATSMVLAFGVQMIIIDILRALKIPAPIRISSLPRGSALRPGIYSIIEDICAVDGTGGTEFRQRLNLRYQASHYFRQMLHRLTLFWAIGALVIGAATTAIIFTVPSRDAAYVVSLNLSLYQVYTKQTSVWMDNPVPLGCHLDTINHCICQAKFEERETSMGIRTT
jgi:hypothetical protein